MVRLQGEQEDTMTATKLYYSTGYAIDSATCRLIGLALTQIECCLRWVHAGGFKTAEPFQRDAETFFSMAAKRCPEIFGGAS